MKYSAKAILTLLLTIVSLNTFAQNGKELSQAYALSQGENSCTFSQGEDYTSSRFFAYTATERGILKIEGSSTIASYTAVGSDSTELSHINYGSSCLIPMNAAQQVFVQVMPNMQFEEETIVNFFASYEANDNAGRGTTPEDPIVMETGKTNITIDTAPGFSEFPAYFIYHATETGALMLQCSGYVLTGRYGSSFDNLSSTFNANYEDGHYTGSVPVKEGETICLSIGAYSAMTVTAQMSHPDKGTSSNYPIELVEGENQVSAEFGEFWYKYDGADVEGYLSFSSTYDLPRGHVIIYSAHDIYAPLAQSETGSYDLRFKVAAHTSYIIKVYKPEESDNWPEPDTFTLAFTPLQQGESASNPLELKANEAVTLNPMNGVFYYVLTVPERTELKMLDFTLTGEAASSCQMRLYDLAEGQYYAITGSTNVKKEAKEGHSYMVIIEKDKAGEASLMPRLRGIEAGESISLPLTAIIGNNMVGQAAQVYYQYTATLTGRISLSFDLPGIGVSFPISSNSNEGEYIGLSEGDKTRLDVEAGLTYYIRLSNVYADCAMTFSEDEYKAGETRELAIEVADGKVTLTGDQTNAWFKYTAAKDGKMVLTSNIVGDNNTYIYYTINDNIGVNAINNSNDDGDIIYYAAFSVNKGDVIYVHLSSAADHPGSNISFSLNDFGQGESLSTAWDLTIGGRAIELPVATRTQYQWVRVPLNGEKGVRILTDRFVSGGVYISDSVKRNFDIEFVADANNEVHTATYQSQTPVEALYVCFTGSLGKITVHAEAFTPVFEDDENDNIQSLQQQESTMAHRLDGTRASKADRGIILVRQADGSIRKVVRK